MKKFISIWILTTLAVTACTQKDVEKTILGIGSDYFTIPETLNGKVKMLRETNYWAIEKDGKFVKGEQMTWKDLDSINSTKDFIAYFDENGKIKQYDHFDINNIIHDSYEGKPENGIYKRFIYHENGKPKKTYQTSYDNLGFIKEVKTFNMNDSLLGRNVFIHDGKGNYTRTDYFRPDGNKLFTQTLSVNDKGKVTGLEVYNNNDSLINKSINTYNENGFLIKMSGSALWEFDYLKFDTKGNWLELVAKIADGKYKVFAERYYEYY